MKGLRLPLPPTKLPVAQVNPNAFPRNFRMRTCSAMIFSEFPNNGGCGMNFEFAWSSSTGSLEDLRQVEHMEKVKIVAASGSLAGLKSYNSRWKSGHREELCDEHFTGIAIITAGEGESETHQLFVYKICPGRDELVAPFSGFKLNRRVEVLGDDKFRVTTTKAGCLVTINQHTAAAGQCTKAEVVQVYDRGNIITEEVTCDV
jgi:hypothetical protein